MDHWPIFATTCETVWAVYPVDADDVAAAPVGADEGDQYVRGLTDERDIHRSADADTERLRQTAGERRYSSGPRIDTRILPVGLGHIQRHHRDQ